MIPCLLVAPASHVYPLMDVAIPDWELESGGFMVESEGRSTGHRFFCPQY